MQVFLVGGAVRDKLMGVPNNDKDYLVVGADYAELLKRGFKNVGESFPVFLHPETGDEWALARTERKTGKGYTGFETYFGGDVTLADDLMRRDLTINAMAEDVETGELHDPFNGRADLEAKLLRHVSEAFREDPLRVVRLARFFARFTDFDIAMPTLRFAQEVVKSGEMDELSNERFWSEMAKAMEQSPDPVRFFDALYKFGVFKNVKFFNSIWGEVDQFTVSKTWKHVLDATSLVDPTERMKMFVALTAKPDAKFPAGSSELVSLFELVQMAKKSRQDSRCDLLDMATKAKAFGENLSFVSEFVRALKVAREGFVQVGVTADQFERGVMAARKVTSEPFRHLEGRKIGEAMRIARLDAIDSTFKRSFKFTA